MYKCISGVCYVHFSADKKWKLVEAIISPDVCTADTQRQAQEGILHSVR